MKITVVKLGGSLVTYKDRPMSINSKAISSVAGTLNSAFSQRREWLFLVHGGGSYGHYYANKFGLSSKARAARELAKAIAITSSAMQELHSAILQAFVNKGLPCKSVDGTYIAHSEKGIRDNTKRKLLDYFDSGLIPISFGNVDVSSKRARIISGDEICLRAVQSFPVDRVIFATDVDGVYADSSLKGDIISELRGKGNLSIQKRKFDVTGGLAKKLETGFKIAALGTDVFFLNGLNRVNLLSCLHGRNKIKGTHIPAQRVH